MAVIVDNKIQSYIRLVSIIYFMNIALYSIIPEFFLLIKDTPLIYSFYWFNHGFFFCTLPYLISKKLINKKDIRLLKSVSLIIAIIAVFQIINCYESLNSCIWITLSTLSIITLLLISKYGSKF